MISVERLQAYTPEDAAGIGRLMPHLSERFTDEPIPEERLQRIIESPYHDQLVARDDGRLIIGAATLSVVMAAGAGDRGYLNDFVTDPESKGAGSAIWNEIGKWCLERGVHLDFTSKPDRTAAHQFYSKRATERIATVFRATFDQDE